MDRLRSDPPNREHRIIVPLTAPLFYATVRSWLSLIRGVSMTSRTDTLFRVAVPICAGAVGALLYVLSPISHQAFCAPLKVPVIVAPVPQPAPVAD